MTAAVITAALFFCNITPFKNAAKDSLPCPDNTNKFILFWVKYRYIYISIVYKVLSIYRVLPGFREFAVFEKSKRFFYIFFGWVLHRGGQGPGKGPNIIIYIISESLLMRLVQHAN